MIFNLTQHPATPEQIAQGVKDLPDELRKQVIDLITFDEPPTSSEMHRRALAICGIVDSWMSTGDGVMIGGAPFFMGPLERALFEECGIVACYSFSKRVVVETTGPDGEVIKTSVFKHVGFVTADV